MRNWSRLSRNIPDLILDLKMPGMGGIEAFDRFVPAPQTLVIMLTAYGTVENAVEAMRQAPTTF